MTRGRNFFSIFLVFILACFSLVGKWYFFDRNLLGQSSLRVESLPKSTVFLNDKEIGQTPLLKDKISAGEYNLKIIPTVQPNTTLSPWQTKIKLNDGTLTYVSWIIASSNDESAGQILTLDPLSTKNVAELIVVANPDECQVILDGLNRGSTPIVIRDLTPGDHQITVTKNGYSDQVIAAKIIAGFRLNAVIKLGLLSKINQATISAQLSIEPNVVIKETPTGFLRVRFEPSVSSSETAQVKPGEKYPLLSEVPGWVKIKLPALSGWVSANYVEKNK